MQLWDCGYHVYTTLSLDVDAFNEFVYCSLLTGPYDAYGGVESDWRQGYGAAAGKIYYLRFYL